MNPRIISADDHIDLQWLPKDLWQKRVPPAWRDRAPKVVETPEGPYWVCGSDRWDPWGGRKGAAGAQGGRRTALEKGGVLEPGVLRPTTTELRLTDMDRDGIDATVMYGPIVPLLIQDPDLREVCYRAYNDWLAEFCATAPDRLVGAGLIPIDDPKTAADEVRHLNQIGLRTGMFLAARVELPLWDEAWEPLWEAAAEAALPIGFHLGGGLRTVLYSGPKATQAGNMGVRVACSTLQMDEPRAPADDGAERLFPTAGVGDLPDGSPRAAGRGPPGGRPGDVGVRLPPRRQHVARVAAGDRGQFQRRRAPGAPPHPVRQRAGIVRALTPGEVQVCSEAPVDAQEHWEESRVVHSVDAESHVSA